MGFLDNIRTKKEGKKLYKEAQNNVLACEEAFFRFVVSNISTLPSADRNKQRVACKTLGILSACVCLATEGLKTEQDALSELVKKGLEKIPDIFTSDTVKYYCEWSPSHTREVALPVLLHYKETMQAYPNTDKEKLLAESAAIATSKNLGVEETPETIHMIEESVFPFVNALFRAVAISSSL